jgi:Flp pilus assembly protein TadG
MSALGGAIVRRLRSDDRGAVAVLIAVLIGSGVLTGMGALVVGIGQLYAERAQLQNGADAAALAVAKSCALGTCEPGLAGRYADANANDGLSAVDLVCGSGSLGGCPASTGAMTDCPPPPGAPGYVDVHTATETADGSSLLPAAFVRTLPGEAGYRGTAVGACAQAEWGPPLTATTLAVTISACEWDNDTSLGTLFASAPPYPPDPLPAPVADQVLRLRTSPGGGCASETAGADGPGAFGWISDPSGTCSVAISGGSYGADTGASAGQSCQLALAAAVASRTPVYVPVYTSVTGTGSGASYALKGFAAFVVTGYSVPGAAAPDWLNPANDCAPPDECINGFFVQALIPGGAGAVGGPDLGATEIRLSG